MIYFSGREDDNVSLDQKIDRRKSKISEVQMKDAIEAIKSGAVTYKETSELFGIPITTLHGKYTENSSIIGRIITSE